MTTHAQDLTLVLGSTGKTGRRVVERLQARGLPVRAGSRSGTPPFDWQDRSTWAPALDGATAAYVAFYPDVAIPGAAETIGAFAQQASASGVRRLVLLSGRGEPEAQLAEQAERAVQAAGTGWTVVRASWFAQNFSESFWLDPVLAGEVALPVDGVPEPFVDVEDVADVAVAALTQDGHEGGLYELTGPRALTFAEAVAEIGRATERELRFVQVPLDAYAAELQAHGLPHEVVELIRYLFAEVLDGRNAAPADGVQRALGRAPRDFAAYARRTAASGAWSPAGSERS